MSVSSDLPVPSQAGTMLPRSSSTGSVPFWEAPDVAAQQTRPSPGSSQADASELEETEKNLVAQEPNPEPAYDGLSGPKRPPSPSSADSASQAERESTGANQPGRGWDELDLHDIKAITMYEMVHEVNLPEHAEPYRVLHATHRQASLMMHRPASVAVLADEFCKHPPKIVLNLLPSLNFIPPPQDLAASTTSRDLASYEDGKAQLETFMQRVLLPIAEEAGALVICDARRNYCLLTAAFMKAYEMRRPAWGSDVRVTVLGFAMRPAGCLKDSDLPEHWRHLLRHLPKQVARQPPVGDPREPWAQLLASLKRQDAQPTFGHDTQPNDPQPASVLEAQSSKASKQRPRPALDLHAGICNLVLIDAIKASKAQVGLELSTKLRAELMSHFNAKTPCIAFKTGSSWPQGSKHAADAAAGLGAAVDSAERNIPVVLLDLFEARCGYVAPRPPDTKQDDVPRKSCLPDTKQDDVPRKSLRTQVQLQRMNSSLNVALHNAAGAQGAKEKFKAKLEQLKEKLKKALKANLDQTVSGMDICELASVIEIYQNHDPHSAKGKLQIPLWLQIAMGETDRDDKETDKYHEHKELRKHLQAFSGKVLDLPGRKDQDVAAYTSHALALMTSDAVSGMNVFVREHTLDDEIRDVLERSRLPDTNSIEASRLLRDAWNEHDAAAALAVFYSRMGRSMYLLQLCLNLFATALVVLAEELTTESDVNMYKDGIDNVLFATSLLSTFLFSVLAFANPIRRWQKLRAAATEIESLIWLFRARCGPFQAGIVLSSC